MRKLKICCVLDHKLMHYRAPLFEALSIDYDIEVVHRGPILDGSWDFKQKVVKYYKVGPFWFINPVWYKSCDILIVMQNLRLLQFWFKALNPFRKYALVFWGIGVSSAKNLSQKKNVLSRVKNFFTMYSDGLGLYSSYALPFYSRKVIDKTIVVGNSVLVTNSENTSCNDKLNFLFIGTLNERKGVDVLLKSFSEYLSMTSDKDSIKILKIIGDGPLKRDLIELCSKLGITDSVKFEGSITDPNIKKRFFSEAVATISPTQAGLSVVESFAYGVPYVTYKRPISGGEYLSINHKNNGYLLNEVKELCDILLELGCDKNEGRRVGNNAYNYYIENLQFTQYVATFKSLINNSYDRFIAKSNTRRNL